MATKKATKLGKVGGVSSKTAKVTAKTKRTFMVDGLKVKAEISPCTFMYKGYGLTEECLVAEKAFQAEEEARQAKSDAKWKAKGFNFVANIWIHAGGDDYMVEAYYKVQPTKKELRAIAEKRGSRILDDFACYAF